MYADDDNIAWLRLDINKLRILKTCGLWRTTVRCQLALVKDTGCKGVSKVKSKLKAEISSKF